MSDGLGGSTGVVGVLSDKASESCGNQPESYSRSGPARPASEAVRQGIFPFIFSYLLAVWRLPDRCLFAATNGAVRSPQDLFVQLQSEDVPFDQEVPVPRDIVVVTTDPAKQLGAYCDPQCLLIGLVLGHADLPAEAALKEILELLRFRRGDGF